MGQRKLPIPGNRPYYLQDTALPAKNLVVEGLNGDPGKSVYGTASGVPYDSKYYIEGVRPGKITLEWRLQKDNIDVTYEQGFLVETHKSPEEWKEDLAYKIRLDTSTDPSGEVDVTVDPAPPEAGHLEAMERLSECYDYYAENFKVDSDLNWSGLARLAGNQVVAGLIDSLHTYDALSGGLQGVTTTASKNEIL